MNSEEFRNRRKKFLNGLDDVINRLEQGRLESERVRNIIENTDQVLDNLDKQFCNQTGLKRVDIIFLFLAIGLQIARQYLLSNERYRFNASQGDELMDDAVSLLPPTWQEILTQSVPYDAIKTGNHVFNTGLAGTTHRYRTLGHDPILGWIFGTANILTNSLTKTDFETYQIKNMKISRRYPRGTMGMLNRAITYSVDNPKLLAVALVRQAIHFGSDYFTKQGLPFPLIASVDNKLAQKMISEWHIDMWSITRGMTITIFINKLIEIMHKLFYTGNTDMDQKLYEVRTRKIITYSNLIATSTNLSIVAITKDMQKLDIGGMSVAIYRLITDRKFIRKIKEEFIFGNYHKLIMGDD